MKNPETTVIYKWFQEVWNHARRDMIDELLADDMISHGLGAEEKTFGRAPFKQFYDDFRNQLKHVHVALDNIISDGEIECARCHVTGEDAITGKKVAFNGMSMARIADGKIAEAWNSYDFLKMYQQLGYELKQ